MKIEPQYFPEVCASRDGTRAHLTNPHLFKASSKLVATDGHMLVAVPVYVEAGDIDGPINPEALRDARAMARKRRVSPYATKEVGHAGLPRIRAGKRLLDTGGTIHRRPPPVTFPRWQEVVPTFEPGEEGTVTIGVNPNLLVAVAKAIGAGVKAPFLTITFELPKAGDEALSPYLVRCGESEAIAVVMPARTSVKHNSKLAKKDRAA